VAARQLKKHLLLSQKEPANLRAKIAQARATVKRRQQECEEGFLVERARKQQDYQALFDRLLDQIKSAADASAASLKLHAQRSVASHITSELEEEMAELKNKLQQHAHTIRVFERQVPPRYRAIPGSGATLKSAFITVEKRPGPAGSRDEQDGRNQ